MQIPNEAIEKAIEGGWKASMSPERVMQYAAMDEAMSHIALDKTFWQSLGKALDEGRYLDIDEGWMEVAMSFYDLILTGSDTEAFWKDLLQN